MKFLETISCLGYDALIPINRIKSIAYSVTSKGYRIQIWCDDENDWTEDFTDKKKADFRYEMIKEILEAK